MIVILPKAKFFLNGGARTMSFKQMRDKGSGSVCSFFSDGTNESGATYKNQLSWHALYTKIHHERKVALRLKEQGIETYVPVQTVMRQWSDRKKKIDVVLIPAMLFVHIAEKERLTVLKDPSVNHFLVAPGEKVPAVIPEEQMERFRFMVDNAHSPVQFDMDSLVAGDPVRVICGSLEGLVGTFIKVHGTGHLYIHIDLLGTACVEIATEDVMPVKMDK